MSKNKKNSKLFEALFPNDQELYTLEQAFLKFRNARLIAEGEFCERATSILTGIAQCRRNKESVDLENGVQLKHATTNYQTQSYTGQLKGHVSINKTRADRKDIYVVVTETVTNDEYFFRFRYQDYCHMLANSLCIPFSLTGKPKRNNHWWGYEMALDDWIRAIQAEGLPVENPEADEVTVETE